MKKYNFNAGPSILPKEVMEATAAACLEFCMVPYNFLEKKAAYLNTGVWATKAEKEAKLFGEVVEVASSKDKVNRVDIVGFLSKVGGLTREQLGRVDVGDHWAYAAVATTSIKDLLVRVRGQKIKGQRTIIELTKP